MSTATDPRMRFRVWVSAQLADEAWVDASNPEAEKHIEGIRARHHSIVNQAERDGKRWLIEVYDPAKPEGWAYLRFGDDDAGMANPRPVRP